jgi:hypothetical protein
MTGLPLYHLDLRASSYISCLVKTPLLLNLAPSVVVPAGMCDGTGVNRLYSH